MRMKALGTKRRKSARARKANWRQMRAIVKRTSLHNVHGSGENDDYIRVNVQTTLCGGINYSTLFSMHTGS